MSTLLLLASAGLGADSWNWTAAPDGFDVVRYEFPGHGSRPAAGSPYTLGDLADEIAASHDGPFHVAGVSMGGMVAQHLLLRHPEKVASAFLACTAAKVDKQTMLERAAASASGMTGDLIETTLRRWFSADAMAQRPVHPGVAYVRHALTTIAPRAFAAAWSAIAEHNVTADLADVHAPVTCVAADADPAAPPTTMKLLADAIPGSLLQVLTGPHLLQIERPAEFGAALAAHLALVGVR
jgi:pimeloyl-ACP methyl ester carboxylesterase